MLVDQFIQELSSQTSSSSNQVATVPASAPRPVIDSLGTPISSSWDGGACATTQQHQRRANPFPPATYFGDPGSFRATAFFYQQHNRECLYQGKSRGQRGPHNSEKGYRHTTSVALSPSRGQERSVLSELSKSCSISPHTHLWSDRRVSRECPLPQLLRQPKYTSIYSGVGPQEQLA